MKEKHRINSLIIIAILGNYYRNLFISLSDSLSYLIKDESFRNGKTVQRRFNLKFINFIKFNLN